MEALTGVSSASLLLMSSSIFQPHPLRCDTSNLDLGFVEEFRCPANNNITHKEKNPTVVLAKGFRVQLTHIMPPGGVPGSPQKPRWAGGNVFQSYGQFPCCNPLVSVMVLLILWGLKDWKCQESHSYLDDKIQIEFSFFACNRPGILVL